MTFKWDKAEIGWWWAECCIQDLYQIETEDDMKEYQERISPQTVKEAGWPAGVWQTMGEGIRFFIDDV